MTKDKLVSNTRNQDGDIIFQVNKAGVKTEVIRVRGASGGIGIGTSTLIAGTKVTFYESTAATDLKIGAGVGDGTRSVYNVFVNNTVSAIGTEGSAGGTIASGTSPYSTVLANNSAYPISFATNNTERMRIDGTGDVGIGTTFPSSRLHVKGNANVVTIEGIDHSYVQWYPDGYAAGRKAYTGFAGSIDNNFTIANEIAGAHIILSPTAGNVGIGTTSPSYKLHVQGDGYLSGKLTLSDASGIVAASATLPGVVSTGAQTFAGVKTFSAERTNFSSNAEINNSNGSIGTGGFWDIGVASNGFVGIICVHHANQANGNVNRSQVFFVAVRGTASTVTSLGSSTGQTGDCPFTLSIPGATAIRVSNTSGSPTFAYMTYLGNFI